MTVYMVEKQNKVDNDGVKGADEALSEIGIDQWNPVFYLSPNIKGPQTNLPEFEKLLKNY